MPCHATVGNMTETGYERCAIRFRCSGRVHTVYACLFSNALLFVILLSTNVTAGVIYLFCFASVVAACTCVACTRYLCERFLESKTNVSRSEV